MFRFGRPQKLSVQGMRESKQPINDQLLWANKVEYNSVMLSSDSKKYLIILSYLDLIWNEFFCEYCFRRVESSTFEYLQVKRKKEMTNLVMAKLSLKQVNGVKRKRSLIRSYPLENGKNMVSYGDKASLQLRQPA